jgi:hypothetical protein
MYQDVSVFFYYVSKYSSIHGLEPVRIYAMPQMQTPLNEKWVIAKTKRRINIHERQCITGIYLHGKCTALAVKEQ